MWCQKVSIIATLKLFFYADPFPLFHPQRRQNKQDIVSGKDSSWVAPARLCGGLLINISGLKLIFNITNQNCSQASFLQVKWANNFFLTPCIISASLLSRSSWPSWSTLSKLRQKSLCLWVTPAPQLWGGLKATSTFIGSLAHPAKWCRWSLSTFSSLL